MANRRLEVVLMVGIMAGWTPVFVGASSRQLAALQGQNAKVDPDVVATIMVERMGGFPGVYEVYSIAADGRVANKTGGHQKIPSHLVEGFLGGIQRIGIPIASSVWVPTGACTDCFYYRVTVRTKGVSRVFMLEEPFRATSLAERESVKAIREFLCVLLPS